MVHGAWSTIIPKTAYSKVSGKSASKHEGHMAKRAMEEHYIAEKS